MALDLKDSKEAALIRIMAGQSLQTQSIANNPVAAHGNLRNQISESLLAKRQGLDNSAVPACFSRLCASTSNINKTAPTVQHVLIGWNTYLESSSKSAVATRQSIPERLLAVQTTYEAVMNDIAKNELAMPITLEELQPPTWQTKIKSFFSPTLRRALVISAFMESIAMEHFIGITKPNLPNAQTVAATPQ